MFRRIKKTLLRGGLFAVVLFVLLSLVITVPLRWINPPTTAFIIGENGLESTILYATWVPINQITPDVPLAVIASEDQKFPTHAGFDMDSIEKALSENRGRMRGASTITQQLAKNLYLWPGRNLVRKSIEAWFTLLLEVSLSKKRIMEIYLNVVEFGPGIYGIKPAAKYHFNKTPESLSFGESALLAATLPNPKIMYAGKPSAYVTNRATDIKESMLNLGGISYLPW